VPYVAVVGDKEAEAGQVAPRSRDLNKNLDPMPLAQFAEMLLAESAAPRLHRGV